MMRKLQGVGILVAGLVLAACGGGGDQAASDAGAKFAAAPMAVVDKAQCEGPAATGHLEGGQCIARFPGLTPPQAAARHENAQKQGARKSSAPKLAAQQPLTTPDKTALFNWASSSSGYPGIFYGSYFDDAIYMPGFGTFNYRYYSSGNYLAVLGSGVYAYGWATGYTIYYVGTLSDFSCYVYSCGGGGGGSGGSLAVGGSVNGAFYTSGAYVDHTVYLYAGTTYTFTMMANTLYDPYLELYNPYGNFVTYDDDSAGNLNARITTTAAYTGYYILRASSYTTGDTGSYTLYATSGTSGGGGGGGGSGGYISWTNSNNGVTVLDANNESFAFEANSRCLYSYNTQSTTTNFCLYSGAAYGSFAGQYVQVMLVASTTGGCIAALADAYGYQIDIYTNNGVQTVTTTNSKYNTTGCTY
ncbi:hypothetical protein [Caenimonas aquaedulcis]|uniref:Peptidase C-terminal archaeal/bacterial domain-containing protein n=1 Tax=Caenimonas aquaedulcis TaxID=2793270 RepID=A0A931MID1_9BURK|nr:hypothetical protein [Caenimonas aquaedulcis]MBG9389867.1 hypothetical protein [Caenimonas aquaedulcis]